MFLRIVFDTNCVGWEEMRYSLCGVPVSKTLPGWCCYPRPFAETTFVIWYFPALFRKDLIETLRKNESIKAIDELDLPPGCTRLRPKELFEVLKPHVL